MKMPDKNLVNQIINNAPINDSKTTKKIDNLNKTQNVSFTIQKRDILWLEETLSKLSSMSRKKVNKSRLMTAGLILLQQKNENEILNILKEI